MDKPLWRPQFYPLTIDVPVELDAIGNGSFKIRDTRFLCKQITHMIIGADLDFDDPGPIQQDGQYFVDFKDERETWQSIPMMADAAFGSVRTGRWIQFHAPIAFAGSQAIQVNVQNAIDRTAAEPEIFKVHFIFHGIELLPTT